jgi:hypothetical protein
MGDLPLRVRNRGKTAEPNDLVTTHTSTVDKIPNYGKTLMGTTLVKTFILENPIPGVRKVLVATVGTTLSIKTVTGATTTVLFANATQTNTSLAFNATGDLIELEGRTSLIWDVISNNSVDLS